MAQAATTTIKAHVLPSITYSWHEAWAIFYKRFWNFVALAIVPQILTTGAVFLLGAVLVGDIKASGSLAQALSPTNVILYVLLASILLLFILQIFAAVAIILAVTKRGHIGFIQAFDEARHFVVSFFLTGILTTTLGLVAIVIGYIALALLTTALVALRVPNTAVWFEALSVVPYALFTLVTARYIFAGIGVVTEKKSAISALKRSAELMRGHYWHIVLRLLLVYSILLLVIYGAAFIPYVGGLLAAALAIPFGVIYTFVLFEELVAART